MEAWPDDFRCPITLEVMTDPVIIPSGHTFERRSIQRWLDGGHLTCPVTNLPLPPSPPLIPNHALRRLISAVSPSAPVSVPSAEGGAPPGRREAAAAAVQPTSPVPELLRLAKSGAAGRREVLESGSAAVLLRHAEAGDEAAARALLLLSLDGDDATGVSVETSQNPHCVVQHCLYWLRARVTLDGHHPRYVEHIESFRKEIKANENETSNKEDDDMINDGTIETIGSVLIATVGFAAAFTVPGGFIADDHPSAGTAIFARRFAFRGFVVSDTMAFVCSIVATCFLMYGAMKVPRSHRLWYNLLASGLVPVAAQFMIAAFAFAFHLVLGDANRGLLVFVYTVCLATVLVCFPGIWVPLHLGLPKALWRRAGWRGRVNVYGRRPSSLRELFYCITNSFLFDNLRRPFFIMLISTAIIVAVALNIALPNY